MLLKNWELAIIFAIVVLASFFLPLELAIVLLLGAIAFYCISENYHFLLLANLFMAYVALDAFDFMRFFRYPGYLLLALLAYFFVKIYFIEKKMGFFIPKQFFAFIGFTAIAMVSAAFNGGNPLSGFSQIAYFDYLIVAFFIIYLTKNLKAVKNTFWLLSIAVLFFALIGLFGGSIFKNFANGISVIENRNSLAINIVPILPLTFALFILNIEKAKKPVEEFLKKIFLIGIFFSGIVVIFLTLSRGAILGIAAILAVLFHFFSDKKIWPAIAIVFMLAVPLFYSSIPKLLEKTSDLEKIASTENSPQILKNSSVVERRDVFIDTIKIFLQNPLLGVGIGNSAQLLGTKYTTYDESLGKEINSKDPHNVYAEVLADVGIFGFVFYLAIIAFTFFDLNHAKRIFFEKKCNEGILITNCLKTAFVGMLVINFFGNEPFYFIFIILIALSIALKQTAIDLNIQKTV